MAIVDNDWIAWRDQMRTELPQAFDDVTASRVARDFRETIAHKAFLAGKSAGRRHPQPVTPAGSGPNTQSRYLRENDDLPVTPDRIQQLEATIARLEEMNAKHAERMQRIDPVTPAGGEVRDFEFLRIVHAYLQKSYIAGVQEITLDELAAVSAAIRSLEHPPVADAALARHWIERYASGVDEELQMDRVLDALGAPSHD